MKYRIGLYLDNDKIKSGTFEISTLDKHYIHT